MATTRPNYDWEKIEAEYRAGAMSVREIGRRNGPAEGTIRKRAKKQGWKKDLARRVRQEVRNQVVRTEVRKKDAAELRTDREIVEASAKIGADVIMEHRDRISKGRQIVDTLIEQLGVTLEYIGEIEETIDKSDTVGTIQQSRMHDAISLPSHAKVVTNLAAAMKTFVSLERQAHNLDATGDDEEANAILGRRSPIIDDMIKNPKKYTPEHDE